MDRRRVAVIVPALNEENTIVAVVHGAMEHGIPIVVDDGSADNTGRIAAEAGADVVRHPSCQGYDRAINSGFERAAEMDCDFVVTIDGDGQHDPRLVGAFIQALEDGADVVIGIRDRKARLAEVIFGWAALMRWGLRDPLCGMKAYRIAVWRDLGHFDRYESIGTELALFAARGQRQIVQIPVQTRERVDAPRFGRRIAANMRILRAAWIGMRGGEVRP